MFNLELLVRIGMWLYIHNFCLPTKLREGNIYSPLSVSHSVDRGRGDPCTGPCPPPVMFKLVHYEARTVSKWAVGTPIGMLSWLYTCDRILLNCLCKCQWSLYGALWPHLDHFLLLYSSRYEPDPGEVLAVYLLVDAVYSVCDFCWELIPDIRSGYCQNLPDRIESYRTK